jgi:plastocyanin
MIVAVIAIVIAVAALAAPYILPAGSTTGETSSQTREFYVFSAENTFDLTPKGLTHYIFSPSQITVNQGDTVLIHFYNAHNDTHHTFTLPAYNINVDLAPNLNQDIRFTASQPGVFTFMCSVHPATMRGQLTVLPA